jgi:hypothetical protein
LTGGLIITSGGLAALSIAALALRRQRERALGRALAERHGWELYGESQRDLQSRLGTASLMRVGHSRRIPEAFLSPGRAYLFSYVFETGFEHRRQSHRWMVVALEGEHGLSRATITAADWLIAAATGTSTHALAVEPGMSSPRSAGARVAIVEDTEEWAPCLQGPPGEWLANQPAQRTWEILPGFIVGYEPGRLREDALAELAAAGKELAEAFEG